MTSETPDEFNFESQGDYDMETPYGEEEANEEDEEEKKDNILSK